MTWLKLIPSPELTSFEDSRPFAVDPRGFDVRWTGAEQWLKAHSIVPGAEKGTGDGKGDGSLFQRGRPTNPKNYSRPLFPPSPFPSPVTPGNIQGHPQFPLATGQTTAYSVRLTIMTLAWSTSDRAKASHADLGHPTEVKGDSHQIWRTQKVQVTVASLRLFLRSSTGPTRDFGFSILDFGLRTEATR